MRNVNKLITKTRLHGPKTGKTVKEPKETDKKREKKRITVKHIKNKNEKKTTKRTGKIVLSI